jgi:hypothetical protein
MVTKTNTDEAFLEKIDNLQLSKCLFRLKDAMFSAPRMISADRARLDLIPENSNNLPTTTSSPGNHRPWEVCWGLVTDWKSASSSATSWRCFPVPGRIRKSWRRVCRMPGWLSLIPAIHPVKASVNGRYMAVNE